MEVNGTSRNAGVAFDKALIERYDGRGPRYTSYPTAVQFDDSFTAADYRREAAASNGRARPRPLSLYVHIPFCHSLCYYCGCNKIVTRNAARVDSYLHSLHAEINMQSALFDRRRTVGQLHFGGGTPTYLSAGQLQRLMRRLRSAFTLLTTDEREFSIEVDPRSVNAASIIELAGLGFNRLSLGIQDFDARVQVAVNRIQPADDVAELMRQARRTGFKSVSFDLIYGLPLQTVDSFADTLEKVIVMRPDRLAVYNYAHLPGRFRGQRMIRETDLPSPGSKLDILHHTIDRLVSAGYIYIGMDHFALPDDDLVTARGDGTLQRNFQGYSTYGGCDLVGLGVSAIGSIGECFVQNTPSTIEYEAGIGAGSLPVKRGLRTSADDRLRAAVIQRLMCYDRLDFAGFDAAHGISFPHYFASELESLEPLEADGLVSVGPDRITITAKGRLLLRNIAMVFDRYLATSDQRFSKAI